jgi:hypothetical protein
LEHLTDSSQEEDNAHIYIYSDNGTNFVGANNILEIWREQYTLNEIGRMGTSWHFIPPTSPHFGGLWEAGVKSTKHHLHRTIGDKTLTFEEYSTLLSQIEACLNSRPLCQISDCANNDTVLTPGHFLIGRGLIAPIATDDDLDETILSRKWKLIQKMKREFWKQWSSQYLHTLQQRYKWKFQQNNLKIGDIVIIKEANISPSKWPLAKVTVIHPSSDGNVRAITLKKSTGSELKRTIHTVVPLPNEEEHASTIETRNINTHTATIRKSTI